MNQALLAKHAWRLANNPNTFWAQIIKDKYFPDGDFWKTEKKAGCSWAWESILEEREFLLTHGYWQIGDSKSVRVLKIDGLIRKIFFRTKLLKIRRLQ